MIDKRALFAEVLLLMEQNGIDAEALHHMRQPAWLERVSVENLRFLLQRHRELRALRERNAGLLERWEASRRERGPDDATS